MEETNPEKKLIILAILAILCISLEIVVHLYFRTAIGYTHIFYLLLVIAAVWYNMKAVYLAAALAATTIIVSIYVGDLNWATFLRVAMFLAVTYVVAYLSLSRDAYREKVERSKHELEMEHSALVGYIAEVASRLKNPVEIVKDNLSIVLSELSEQDPDIETIRIQLALQMKNSEQILENLRQLNQVIVEKHDEIPQAYHQFLTR